MKYLDILWDDMGATIMFGETTCGTDYILGSKEEVWSELRQKYCLKDYKISEAHIDDFDMPEYDYEDAY